MSIEQLERKIQELENTLRERESRIEELLQRSEKAMDTALHAYKLDAYGFLWTYNADTKLYVKTNMRVMSPEIVDKAIKTRHLADKCVTGEKIEDNAIGEQHIKDKTIQGRSIAPNAVDNSKLAPGAVTAEKLAPECITGDDLPGDIPNGKLANDAIHERNIKDSSVSTRKLKDNAVTPQKAAEGTITKPKVVSSASGTFTLSPNILHIITSPITNVTFELGETIKGVVNEYLVQFTCGTNAVVNFPSNIRWIDNEPLVAEPDITYQVSIVNNLAVFASWEPTN